MTKNQSKPSRHATPTSKIKHLSERELSHACGGDADPTPSANSLTQQYVKNA